jgi:hypothetical protein
MQVYWLLLLLLVLVVVVGNGNCNVPPRGDVRRSCPFIFHHPSFVLLGCLLLVSCNSQSCISISISWMMISVMYDVRSTVAYAVISDMRVLHQPAEAAVQCTCGGATFGRPQNRGCMERSWAVYEGVLYLKIKNQERQIKISI